MSIVASKRTSLDVLSTGSITVSIPDIAAADAELAGQAAVPNGNTHAKLSELPKRSLVFYDEKIALYIKLQLPSSDLSSILFNAYLSRLVFTVDVAVVNFTNARYSSLGPNQQAQDHNDASFAIFSTVIDRSQLVYMDEAKSEKSSIWTALWRVDVVISHPKARMVNPRISVSTRASLTSKGKGISVWTDDIGTEQVEYLEPNVPLHSVNILQGLAQDVYFNKGLPTLSASKIGSRPRTNSTTVSSLSLGSNIRLPHLYHTIFTPVYPCINLRLRYSRLPNSSTSSEDNLVILANLDVDVTSFAGTEVIIRNIEMSATAVKSIRIPEDDSMFPIRCRPRDTISQIFKLYPIFVGSEGGSGRNSTASNPLNLKNFTSVISVKIECVPVLNRSGGLYNDGTGPDIFTNWNTTIDFANATASGQIATNTVTDSHVNSSALAIPQPGYRSISGTNSSTWQQMQHRSASTPGLVPESPMLASGGWGQLPTTPSAVREIVHEGLSLTFTGPTEVRAGEVFTWKVYIYNQSRTPKRISLIVQPKKWKVNHIKALPRHPPETNNLAILDETAIYTAHQVGMIESDELISLVNDIRIGPLTPGATHETELRLVALGVGVLSFDGLRIVDLIKGEGFDCLDLMNVICRE
ncbi:TRAPP trafficking subunit Trs65-domain-containing protein [Lipomyces japonicus]|uniref:TRAPP trafficking subunit Trs65-domain-containing protein n=1 Tax=Lipomyces japonicus TaxID=56871 RepID=UPI0034CF3535